MPLPWQEVFLSTLVLDNVCVCVHVYMCVHMYICVHMYMCVCTCVYRSGNNLRCWVLPSTILRQGLSCLLLRYVFKSNLLTRVLGIPLSLLFISP